MNFALFFSYMIPGIILGMMVVFAVREERTPRKKAAVKTSHVAQTQPRAVQKHSVPSVQVSKPQQKLYIHDMSKAA